MPTISYDGQSLSIDGRRVWLVSGSIHYARVPHQLWRDRIRAARLAGLNCIETPVFWNVHEPSPGAFHFEGDANLRAFIQCIAEEGMFCILRPGPFIGADWDFGGLPAWLHGVEGIQLRQANGPFLEACARYLHAVMEQVRDLQVSTSAPPKVAAKMPGGGGGPILLMQAENQWLCDNPDEAERYLAEILRYLRENGASVPILDGNNLWSQVEGTIAAWSGNQRLPAHLRQLRQVQPEVPRLVGEYWSGTGADVWGGPHHAEIDAELYAFRLAGILAAGAQFNIVPFHGGTNFGFRAGRRAGDVAAYITTSYDSDAPLSEAGGCTEKYFATKRIATFASQFSHLFAHLEPDHLPATLAPDEQEPGISVLHQRGSQGEVVFLLRGSSDRRMHAPVLLPQGRTLDVPLGNDRVAWIVFNTRLGGMAELTYTNLRPWAFVDRRMLVLFGPAGSQGVVAINDAVLQVKPPAGHEPLVVRHEDLTIVVLNREQVDAAWLMNDRVVVGAAMLDGHGQPSPLRGWSQVTTVQSDGEVTVAKLKAPPRITAPRLGRWKAADVSELVTGQSERFEPIDGPTEMATLGVSQGYGWYRIDAKGAKAGQLLLPRGGDRLHVYQQGKPVAILGNGPEATREPVSLKLDSATVVLADHLGRFSTGWQLGDPKGVADHLHAVKPVKLGRPETTVAPSPDLFALRGYFEQARVHDRPNGTRLTWSVKPVGRNPIIVDISVPWRAMLLVNGEPVGAYDPYWSGGFARVILHVDEQITSGQNSLTLAAFEVLEGRRSDVSKTLMVYQATANVTAKAKWAFAAWSLPSEEAFESVVSEGRTGVPMFYRCRFNVSRVDVPLWLEPRGMSKGQIYLNGYNVGRYFNATASGKSVGPQKRYYLPEPWLRTDEANDLILFDEHGKSPGQVRLVYQATGPYGK